MRNTKISREDLYILYYTLSLIYGVGDPCQIPNKRCPLPIDFDWEISRGIQKICIYDYYRSNSKDYYFSYYIGYYEGEPYYLQIIGVVDNIGYEIIPNNKQRLTYKQKYFSIEDFLEIGLKSHLKYPMKSPSIEVIERCFAKAKEFWEEYKLGDNSDVKNQLENISIQI